jgi:maleamate amidohydrolase
MTSQSPAHESRIDQETQQRYADQGWGAEPIGFGESPALLIVDMQVDFVDPDAPSTCAPIAQERLPAIQSLLAASRAASIPVFFTQGLVDPSLIDVGLWKANAQRDGQVQVMGTRGAEIVSELAPLPTEHVIQKRRPSGFFGTELDLLLRSYRVDTILLAGSSMSGCVRATVVDAFSYDYRVMVVRECVVDRTMGLIDRNLFDVNAKYADVVSLADTIAYLSDASGPQGSGAKNVRE